MKTNHTGTWACAHCYKLISGGRRALWEHYWSEHKIARGHVLKQLNKLTKQQMERDRNENKESR